MSEAFEASGEQTPTLRVVGIIEDLTEDGFSGTIEDPDGDRILIEVPISNISDPEKSEVVPGRMFYCDLELTPTQDIARIRGFEFSDELNQPLPGPTE
jgi:hypothetical protein